MRASGAGYRDGVVPPERGTGAASALRDTFPVAVRGKAGTIVNALLRKFVADHGNIPCLKMEYDGHEQAGEDLRLEAFMHQARRAAAARQERAPAASSSRRTV